MTLRADTWDNIRDTAAMRGPVKSSLWPRGGTGTRLLWSPLSGYSSYTGLDDLGPDWPDSPVASSSLMSEHSAANEIPGAEERELTTRYPELLQATSSRCRYGQSAR
jgi:hypothetical protein